MRDQTRVVQLDVLHDGRTGLSNDRGDHLTPFDQLVVAGNRDLAPQGDIINGGKTQVSESSDKAGKVKVALR
jgi:hypothetical protein